MEENIKKPKCWGEKATKITWKTAAWQAQTQTQT